MNVKALLQDSPSDLHRRPRHDPTDNNSQWSQRQPPSPTPSLSLPPSAQPPPSTLASLRPIDSPRQGIDPGASRSANPAAVAPAAGVGRRIPTPTPLTAPTSVTAHGVWSPDKSTGSAFLKERDAPRDLRDWDRVQRDQRDQRRDQLRDRERPSLHPPLPPPLAVFGDPLRRKNIAMEVNGPLAGPGIPLGPGIPNPDDLAARSHPSGPSSRRPSISNSTIDVGKKMASPTEDEIRGRESQQRHQEIQLKERPVREPSRERERENWENDHAYQRNGPRKIIKAYNPYAPEQTRDYRYINSGLDGPGIPPSSDYRGPYRMQPPGQPPPPPPHPSMRDGGRTTPKAELVVLNRSNATVPPVTTSERDCERDSGTGPLMIERERERDRERALLHPQYGDRDRDREREWEREHSMHMGYPDGDRERGQPPPPMGSVPPHSSHSSLPPPSLSHGHGGHSHPHSHSHSHGHPHHHQHHSQHREQGSHSHSHLGVTHHRPSSSGPHHHQPPGPHKGPPHGHSSSRHPPQLIHHLQPQPPGQIQLLPHPQQQHSHGHIPHPHPHPHPHSSQPPPPHLPSSQPHSPHPSHMHGPPPSQPHPAYRSQPPSQPSAPGPLGGEMSPHHHHHYHHHPTPPSHPSTHHPPPPAAPPPQRQFQSQFHTQFIPGIPQPGSRMGSPAPGPMPYQQQQQQQQQQRIQAPPQSQGGPPSTSGPPLSHQQQQLPSSGSKSVGLGLSGVPGLDSVDANNNVAAKRDSPRSGKRTLVGIKTVDKERDGPVPLDKNGGRRSYMDIDEAEVVEEPESDVGHAALTDNEESEEEREFKAKVQVNLGTFVYPRLPFPYFFDLGRGIPVCVEKRDGDGESESKEVEAVEQDAKKVDQSSTEARSTEKNDENDEPENTAVVDKCGDTMDVDGKEKDKDAVPKEDKDLLDLETRVTVIIPNGHIPLKRPLRPKIWGGGLSERRQDSSKDIKADLRVNYTGKRGQPEFSTNSNEGKQVATAQRRRRRIYTDDSDLFLCALHSGWLTWSGAVQAKAHRKDMKLDLRVIRCCSAAGGARLVEGVTGKEEIVGRFLGGCGERCFNDAGKAQKPKEQRGNKKQRREKEKGREDKDGDRQPDTADAEDSTEGDASDSDDDGRGLESAAWGSGHDGSAIEVLGVEFLEKATARTSPGLGLRNRPQRMWEYSERRMAILGYATSNARGPLTRLAGRKRRRACDWQLSYPRHLPNATILDAIPECEEEEDRGLAIEDDNSEERTQMSIHTVVFGIGKISTGFKYVPSVLQDVLFPEPSIDCQPPKKRRKVDDSADVEMADAQPSAQQAPRNPPRPIVLLTESEQYLLSPCTAERAAGSDLIKYDVSLFAPARTAESATATNGDGQALEPNTDIKPLKSGVGQHSFRFLREEIVIEEDLKICICHWRWGASSVAI